MTREAGTFTPRPMSSYPEEEVAPEESHGCPWHQLASQWSLLWCRTPHPCLPTAPDLSKLCSPVHLAAGAAQQVILPQREAEEEFGMF